MDAVVAVIDYLFVGGSGGVPVLHEHVCASEEAGSGLSAGSSSLAARYLAKPRQVGGGFLELLGAPCEDVGLALFLHIVGLLAGQSSRDERHILKMRRQIMILRGPQETRLGCHSGLCLGV